MIQPWKSAGLLLAACGCWAAPAAAADPAPAIENVRVGLQNTYKAGAWTPIWVDVKGPFAGTLEIAVPDEDGTPALTRLPVNIPGASEIRTVAAYGRPGTTRGEITARLEARGRTVGRVAHPDDRNAPQPIGLEAAQTLIAALGNPQGLAELPALAGFSGEAQSLGRPPELVVVRPKAPAGLPGRWYGYDGASVIVLDANDADAVEALRARGEGLREWVRRGGHLVVAGATNLQAAAEALGDLPPARPAGTTRLNDLGEIESFARSTTNPIPADALTVARLEPLGNRPAQALAASTSTPLVLRGAYGFGRVTLVGLDVDQQPFAGWKDKPLFWMRALDLRSRSGDADSQANPGGGAFYQNQTSDLAGVLFRAMDRPPGVTMVPFGWVAFFVFLYILLIGPGDYFFLKKVARRMELTWITFPLIVVAVSAAAYLAAHRLKGSDLKIVQVDAVDVDQPEGLVRGSSWINLYSPQNRDYSVAVDPVGPAAPPARQTARLLSAFGPPEPQLGGGGGGLNLSATGYAYAPEGEADALTRVRVPIWSTKSFSARWAGPLPAPLIEADLVPAGTDRLDGTIVNRTDRTLRDCVLVFGNQVYDQLGTLAPGASARVGPTSRVRPLTGYLEERAQQALPSAPPASIGPGAPASRPERRPEFGDLVRTLMFRQGMSPKTTTPPSLPLRGLDLTGHLALERPMLVATLDGPAAELKLGGGPDTQPKAEQTAVLRVILGLKDRQP